MVMSSRFLKENRAFHRASRRAMRRDCEAARAVARDALDEINFPAQVFVHRASRVAAALIGLEPNVNRVIRHAWLLRERMAGGLPGHGAAGEPANLMRRDPSCVGDSETCERAILGREHERATRGDFFQRLLQPRADREPRTWDVP